MARRSSSCNHGPPRLQEESLQEQRAVVERSVVTFSGGEERRGEVRKTVSDVLVREERPRRTVLSDVVREERPRKTVCDVLVREERPRKTVSDVLSCENEERGEVDPFARRTVVLSVVVRTVARLLGHMEEVPTVLGQFL